MTRIFLGLLVLLVVAAQSGTAGAQSVAWAFPIDAVMQSNEGMSSFRLVPDWNDSAFSGIGSDGLVITGCALLNPWEIAVFQRCAGTVVKVSAQDGHILWRWQASPIVDVDEAAGVHAAVDAHGDVYVTGHLPGPGLSIGFFLAKLDGVTGLPLWHIAETRGSSIDMSFGTDVAIDSTGHVVLSIGVGYHTQEIRRITPDGMQDWTTALVGWADSEPLAVEADPLGDVIAAADRAGGDVSLRVARLRGADGSVAWTTQSTGRLVRVLANGDVIVRTSEIYRLAHESGEILWQSLSAEPFGVRGVFEDSARRLFVFGSLFGESSREAAIDRLDPTTGAVLWTRTLPRCGTNKLLRAGRPGEVLATCDNLYDPFIQVAALDAITGEVLWQVELPQAQETVDHAAANLVRAADGSIFAATYSDALSGESTYTLYKITGPFADDIFANGFDR